MPRVLGLIPARGGSKSIPGKNIVPLAGRPLLEYTCRAARDSRTLSRIVLSTDDEAIAAVGSECGVEVPFMRPAELATDESSSVDTALHAMRWLAREENWETDILVLLQPTSPLRRSEHIDAAVNLLKTRRADTVVSVVKVPHRCSPYSVMQMESGRLRDFWQAPLPFDRYRRQAHPVFFARNGPAVLVSRARVVSESHGFYGSCVLPYLMEKRHSVDIDSLDDLELAAWYLERRKGQR